jgi:hypothetical protein
MIPWEKKHNCETEMTPEAKAKQILNLIKILTGFYKQKVIL